MSKVRKYTLLAVTAFILCVSLLVGGILISANYSKTGAKGAGAEYYMETGTSVSINGDGLRFRVKMNAEGKDAIDDSTNPLSVVIVGYDVYEEGIENQSLDNEGIYEAVKDNYCVEVKIPAKSIYQEGDEYFGNAVLTGLNNPFVNDGRACLTLSTVPLRTWR